MRPVVLKYGGRGVAVSLVSMTNPGTDTVFWSKGHNSFVVVDSPERGQWKTERGQRVDLASVNGIGEVRWVVDSHGTAHWGEGAQDWFNLVPWSS